MVTGFATAEQTYVKHLAALQAWAGWFVLVRDDRLGGVFPTYEAAATAWMAMYGPVPALIRRIETLSEGQAALEGPAEGDRPAGVTRPVVAARPAETAEELGRRGDLALGWTLPNAARNAKKYAA